MKDSRRTPDLSASAMMQETLARYFPAWADLQMSHLWWPHRHDPRIWSERTIKEFTTPLSSYLGARAKPASMILQGRYPRLSNNRPA